MAMKIPNQMLSSQIQQRNSMNLHNLVGQKRQFKDMNN